MVDVLKNCELNDEGFSECPFKITELFQAGKSYEMITARPYLVVHTEISGVYAFVDLGFSGSIEQSESNSHGLWKNATLDAAKDENGSHVLMIGLTALKHFGSFTLDYRSQTISFDQPAPPDSQVVDGARPFSSFESEMFALNVILRDDSGREAAALAFIDTGNPSSFVLNKAFAHELAGFGVDSSCKCGTPGLESVSVQGANLTLKSHDIDLFMGGHHLNETLRGVCDVSECGSEHLNTVIRNPKIHPAVSLNLGNDSLTKLSYLHIDFDAHEVRAPRPPPVVHQPQRGRMAVVRGPAADDGGGWKTMLAAMIGVFALALVLAVAFGGKRSEDREKY